MASRLRCSTAIEADEKAVLAFKKRATAHSGMGDYGAAQRDLGVALQLEPGSVSVHLQRWVFISHMCSEQGCPYIVVPRYIRVWYGVHHTRKR